MSLSGSENYLALKHLKLKSLYSWNVSLERFQHHWSFEKAQNLKIRNFFSFWWLECQKFQKYIVVKTIFKENVLQWHWEHTNDEQSSTLKLFSEAFVNVPILYIFNDYLNHHQIRIFVNFCVQPTSGKVIIKILQYFSVSYHRVLVCVREEVINKTKT